MSSGWQATIWGPWPLFRLDTSNNLKLTSIYTLNGDMHQSFFLISCVPVIKKPAKFALDMRHSISILLYEN